MATKTTRAPRDPDYYRAIGAKGAATTNARHAKNKKAWGKKGYEVRLHRRWNDDPVAFGNWLSAKGNAATDPAPWNGIFPDPGPEPIAIDSLLDRDFINCTR